MVPIFLKIFYAVVIKTKVLVTKDAYSEIVKKRKNSNTEIKYDELKGLTEWGVVGDLFYMQYIVTKQPKDPCK